MKLKSIPIEERPRERLRSRGPDALSTIELLAILLGSGTKNCSVLQLAADLIGRFGSLKSLSEASVQELSLQKGIGPAKALVLKASFSLFSRLDPNPSDKIRLDDPRKIFDLIHSELKREKVEILVAILLDTRRNLIHKETVSRGTLNEILVHPREIFHLAIHHRAHSLVIAHNHPSGDPTPSKQDVRLTETLKQTGDLLGIPLIDHLIIGGDAYISFADKKFI